MFGKVQACSEEVVLTPPHPDLNPTLASAKRPPSSSLASQFGCATPVPEQEENHFNSTQRNS